MSKVEGARNARVCFRKKYIFKFFNLLRFIGIDIVQTTMSVSTLYFLTFSSYMQKTTWSYLLFSIWTLNLNVKKLWFLFSVDWLKHPSERGYTVASETRYCVNPEQLGWGAPRFICLYSRVFVVVAQVSIA